MAVEIINTGNKEYLEVLYHFEDEKLHHNASLSSLSYTFSNTTSSKLICLENNYQPKHIHVTKKLHGPVIENMFELVMECYYGTKKLFFCLGVEFNNKNEVYVDLNEPDFNKIFSKCKPPILYQTKSGNFVFVTKTVIS